MEDCDCFVERLELEDSLNETKEELEIKKCPSCSKPIYNLRRYQNIVSKIKNLMLQAIQKTSWLKYASNTDMKPIQRKLNRKYISSI